MSVATSAAGGGGYMPMPMQALPQMKAPNFGGAKANQSTMYKMQNFEASQGEVKDIRGDLSGDECPTIDFDDVIVSAVWLEKESKCAILPSFAAACEADDTTHGKISRYVKECVHHLEQIANTTALSADTVGTSKKSQSAKNKKKRKETNSACGKGGITLVLENSIDQSTLRSSVASVTTAGYIVKNVFGRGIATVTGVLARSAKYSEPANDLIKDLKVSNDLKPNPEEESIIFYLHLRNEVSKADTKTPNSGAVYIDAAIISLEYGKGIKNKIGLERLSTLSVTDGISFNDSKDALDKTLKDTLKNLLHSANIAEGKVSAIVFAGSSTSSEQEKQRDAAVSRVIKGVPIYRALKEDAVRGGCMLSAGELDSSKEYLQQPDGSWVVAYQLPVADGHLCRQVGLIVQEGPSSPADATPEILFSSRRLWKLEIGPIKPGSIAKQEDGLARVTREYACMGPSMVSRVCGMLGFGDKKSDEQKKRPLYGKTGAWPRLTLVQRVCSDGVGSDVAWTKMGGEVILPLGIRAAKPSTAASGAAATEKDADKVDPVDSCTVTFLVSPHTGLTVVSEQKGRLLKDRRDDFWFWMQVAVFVLFLALLFASPWLIAFFRERSVKALHIKWLKDFYKLHAPEKLIDPEYVERTVRKYKGRMFLLWRGLKRTYNVDFPAPSSILEGAGADL